MKPRLGILIILLALVSCNPTPDPALSPLAVPPADAVPFGFLGFSRPSDWDDMAGTLAITRTLRTDAGQVIASAVHSVPAAIQATEPYSSDVGPASAVDMAWYTGLDEPATEYIRATWALTTPTGVVVLPGRWYTDTAGVPVDITPSGDYRVRDVVPSIIFLPVVPR